MSNTNLVLNNADCKFAATCPDLAVSASLCLNCAGNKIPCTCCGRLHPANEDICQVCRDEDDATYGMQGWEIDATEPMPKGKNINLPEVKIIKK